jgi:hypothetical protein
MDQLDAAMSRARVVAVVAALAACACAAAPESNEPGEGYQCDGPGARFATAVTSFEFGSDQAFGQDRFPEPVLGPPEGSGCCAGSMHVTSLGDGGFAVLEFERNVVLDGPGPDFIVFENPFQASDTAPETVFAELGTVSVSQDGETWSAYPCAARAFPFGACAGWHPVLANAKTNDVDALDPLTAGGDAYDLSELGLDWARYVRIDDVPEAEGGTGTFDLDAVAIVQPGCL